MINLRPRRRTTKWLVAVNGALLWGLVWYSTYHSMPDIAIAGIAAIGGIFGGYVGVGHLDYRSVLNNTLGTGYAAAEEVGDETYAVGFHTDHSPPEGEEE